MNVSFGDKYDIQNDVLVEYYQLSSVKLSRGNINELLLCLDDGQIDWNTVKNFIKET